MALGRKTGGRTKGVPNKITSEMRVLLAKIVAKQMKELDAMIDETRFGIEIEKQVPAPDGKGTVTVVGRLNADPGKAADLVLRAARFCVPEMARAEVTGIDSGPLEVVVVHETRKDD
jgi:hypothetical protein